MYSALIEATSDGSGGRRLGDRHKIIAVVVGDEADCVPRVTAELTARGWSNIEVNGVGPVVRSSPNGTPGYINAALADADATGFGLVVYIDPVRPS